jgi:hypothetical protein
MRIHPSARPACAFVLLCAGVATAWAQPITLHSLLQEMADRDALARFPAPAYTQGQGSTYNRASTARDQANQGAGGWFADSDGPGYIRTENTNAGGATEYVIVDHTGPGAITKLWTPFFYYGFDNRTGPRIKVYLNGSNTPVLNENLIELVTRLEWSTVDYGAKPSPQNSFTVPSPIAGFTARAGNCYLPIPFASRCKVTMSAAPFYDIVSYRAYAPGTTVENFSMPAYHAASNQMALTAQQIGSPTNFTGGQIFETNRSLAPAQAMSLALNAGAAAVRHLEIQLDPAQVATNPAALRSTVLMLNFDGEPTVWCPLGDFFGCANGVNALQTWTRTVTTSNALLVCRWVMPYQTSASVTLTNLGTSAVTARLAVRTGAWAWDSRSMHFSAAWRPDHVQVGSQFVDWNFVDVTGQGVLVGDAWTVLNRTSGWWGEGDEKIYVDGEYDGPKFPGQFGTGTEDYYGWAGGVNPTKTDEFFMPYLANQLVGSAGNNSPLGFNINTRIRALDAIPFTTRLVFDMEASPGTDQRNPWDLLCYSGVTFWYALPGATHNRPPQPAAAAKPITSLAQLNAMSDALRYGTNNDAGTGPGARWNLGEQDSGATAGGAGNATTIEVVSGKDLTKFGSPTYSATVPAGGSTLAVFFNGTNSCYQASGAAISNLFRGINFNQFSLALDVRPTALGSAGFSFPVSLGRNFGGGGGYAIVEEGGRWKIHHPGTATVDTGVNVALNTWTHLELRRANFGSGVQTRLFVNGVDTGAANSSASSVAQPFFTLGANQTSGTTPGTVEGRFKGQIDNVVLQNLNPVIVSGPSLTPNFGTIPEGGAFSFAAVTMGAAPLTHFWRRNGVAVTNSGASSSVSFSGATPGQSGNYDLVVTNQQGAVTSAPIAVTIVASSTPTPTGTLIARYRLGEDDPGAVAGAAGQAVTKDSMRTNDLARSGAPTYSANVAAGGSTLAMSFNGTDSFYQGSGAAFASLYASFDFNNFSLSCDVFPTAYGGAGFSFPVSIGSNGGGLAIVESGGFWHLIHQGVTASSAGPAVALNTWTHLEMQRRDFGSGVETRLFLNGSATPACAIAGPPGAPTAHFTIGANQHAGAGAGTEGWFKGQMDNVVLTSFTPPTPAQLSVTVASGLVRVSCSGTPGATYQLLRTQALISPSWVAVTSGLPDLSGRVVLVDPAPPVAGAFYRTSGF